MFNHFQCCILSSRGNSQTLRRECKTKEPIHGLCYGLQGAVKSLNTTHTNTRLVESTVIGKRFLAALVALHFTLLSHSLSPLVFRSVRCSFELAWLQGLRKNVCGIGLSEKHVDADQLGHIITYRDFVGADKGEKQLKSRVATYRLSRKVERPGERLTAGVGSLSHLNWNNLKLCDVGQEVATLSCVYIVFLTNITFTTPSAFWLRRHKSKISDRGLCKRDARPDVNLGSKNSKLNKDVALSYASCINLCEFY